MFILIVLKYESYLRTSLLIPQSYGQCPSPIYDLDHKRKKMIDIELLRQYGAVEKQLHQGEMLFQEGDEAVFFYQILRGSIKMSNYNDEGQESLQGIFEANQSFGEPALFGNFPFPANAEALQNTQLICLEKSRLIQLLQDHFDVHFQLLATLSRRLRYKAILSKEIKGNDAANRILSLLQYLKGEAKIDGPYQVNITRQVIANLTGLRVETVIRSIKSLEKAGHLQLRDRKILI